MPRWCLLVTEQEWAKLEPLVLWRIRKWAGHPDWEDIQQEARIGAWLSLQKTGNHKAKPSTIAARAAEWRALDFLRYRAMAGRRMRRPEQMPDPPIVSLDMLQAIAHERDEDDLDKRDDMPREDDFAPALVEQLEAAALIERGLAACTPTEREVLEEVCLKERSAIDVAREKQCTGSAVSQRLLSGKQRMREALILTVLLASAAMGQNLSVSPTVAPGASLSVTWSGLPNPTPKDWVGLARPGVSGDPHLEWAYTGGTSAGRALIPISPGRAPGTYEVRLFRNDGFTVAAVSGPVTVGTVALVTGYGPREPVGPDVPLTAAERTAFTRRVPVAGRTAAAISAACAQAKAQGIPVVHLPAGTYVLESVVKVPGGLTLLGEGSGTVVRGSGELFFATGGAIRFTRLKLVGATSEWSSANGSRGIQSWGQQSVNVDHCRLTGFSYGVLYMQGASGTVSACAIRECRALGYGYGVVGNSGAVVTVTDNELGDCRIAAGFNGPKAGEPYGAGSFVFSFNRLTDMTPNSTYQKAHLDTHTMFKGSFVVEGNDFQQHPVDAIGFAGGHGSIRRNRFTDYYRAVRLYTATEGGVTGSPSDVALSANEFVRVTNRYFVSPEVQRVTVDGLPLPPGARKRR